jgi:hypothetical protein
VLGQDLELRPPQSLAIETEYGPQGGDELNLILKARKLWLSACHLWRGATQVAHSLLGADIDRAERSYGGDERPDHSGVESTLRCKMVIRSPSQETA